MKLIKINRNEAIYKDGDTIIIKTINKRAKEILEWYSKNIIANE